MKVTESNSQGFRTWIESNERDYLVLNINGLFRTFELPSPLCLKNSQRVIEKFRAKPYITDLMLLKINIVLKNWMEQIIDCKAAR